MCEYSLLVCACVCIYMYACLRVRVYMHTYMHVCIHIHTQVYSLSVCIAYARSLVCGHERMLRRLFGICVMYAIVKCE